MSEPLPLPVSTLTCDPPGVSGPLSFPNPSAPSPSLMFNVYEASLPQSPPQGKVRVAVEMVRGGLANFYAAIEVGAYIGGCQVNSKCPVNQLNSSLTIFGVSSQVELLPPRVESH